MIKTIFGLILLLMPFLLIYKFKDKKNGFVFILSLIIGFQLIIAILTQALSIFNYLVILIINLIACFWVVSKINFKEFKNKLSNINIDWVLVFVIIVLLIQLCSVHYNYTGKITTAVQGYNEVENIKYPYPYFSDEWVAVSLIKYSIETGKLPLVNPLWYNENFPNFELPFHSFASEIILLLDLNPITQYTFLHIFSGLLICVLIYFILRIYKIGRITSAITCLLVSYIVNGANLPGIWTFIPLIMGLICFLCGMFFICLGNTKMIFVMAFLTLIFYPPLFLFYTLSLILYFLRYSKKEKIKLIGLYFGICGVVGIILSLFAFFSMDSFNIAISFILSRLFYPTFTNGAIPDFSIWKVMPFFVLILAGFGIFKIRNKIWLIAPVFLGLTYWLVYSKVLWRFIIEYERVVFFTSILIILASGFGLHYLINYFKKYDFVKQYRVVEISMIFVLIIFFVFSFSYTERTNWQELKLHSLDGNVYNPASPANNYLHPDDLKLFENIKEKRFLSIPWKGSVIGVATDNYPLETKPSTITNKQFRYLEFMNSDCDKKIKIARNEKIDYIYSSKFECEGFELRGISSEGLHLYEFV